MRLILTHGYPYPFPESLSEAEEETISANASNVRLELEGVVHFEWLHTITVQFASREEADCARSVAGWEWWDEASHILEAPSNVDEGYNHPAILAENHAYCGFQLVADK